MHRFDIPIEANDGGRAGLEGFLKLISQVIWMNVLQMSAFGTTKLVHSDHIDHAKEEVTQSREHEDAIIQLAASQADLLSHTPLHHDLSVESAILADNELGPIASGFAQFQAREHRSIQWLPRRSPFRHAGDTRLFNTSIRTHVREGQWLIATS